MFTRGNAAVDDAVAEGADYTAFDREIQVQTSQTSVSVVVGVLGDTLVEGDETVGVVIPTGHAIAKSLRRMIRRMSRKPRGPSWPRVLGPLVPPSVSPPGTEQRHG